MSKGLNCDRKSQFSEILTEPLNPRDTPSWWRWIMKYLSVEFLCKEYKSEKRSCSSAKKSREFISYLQNNSVGKKRNKESELKTFEMILKIFSYRFINRKKFRVSFLKPEKFQVFILSGTIPEFHFTENFPDHSFYIIDF